MQKTPIHACSSRRLSRFARQNDRPTTRGPSLAQFFTLRLAMVRHWEEAIRIVTLHSIRGLTPLIFQHCPLFHCRFIALKSRTFVVKSRTTFAIKFVRDLNAKSTPMGDCGRGCLGRGARRSLARVSRAWPPSLRRRLASALAHTTRRDVLCCVCSDPLCPRFEYKQALNSAI